MRDPVGDLRCDAPSRVALRRRHGLGRDRLVAWRRHLGVSVKIRKNDDLLVLAEGSTAESRTSQGRYWTMTGVVEQGVLPASLQLSGPFVVPMPSSPSTFEPQHCTVPPDSRAHAA
jgi:hypothetical protein